MLFRSLVAAAMAVAILGSDAAPAATPGKVALVIGNAAYPEAPLRNAVNDAREVALTLRERGFEVILRADASKQQMERAVVEFGSRLTEGAVGLFFYSGHGMQVNGRNLLIPVDARITTEQSVRLETLDIDTVLDQMSAAHARVSMVILDACRNNPFERRFRSSGGGLAQINAPEGTLIAYSTAPGKVAADGEGAYGLYTRELLRAVATPGLKVEDVFKQVRVNVSRASGGAQVPWEASSLTGDFFFTTAAATPASVPAPSVQGDRELAFWDAVKASNDPADFRDYLAQFPNGTFAALARRRLATLSAPPQAAASPEPAPPPPTPAAPPPVIAAPAAPPAVPTAPAIAAAPESPPAPTAEAMTPPPAAPAMAMASPAAEPPPAAPAAAPAPRSPAIAALPPSPPAARPPLAFRFDLPAGALGPRAVRLDAEAKDRTLTLAGHDGARGAQRRECRGEAEVADSGEVGAFAISCVAPGGEAAPATLQLAGRVERRGESAGQLRLTWADLRGRPQALRIADRASAEKAAAERAAATRPAASAAPPPPRADVQVAARPSPANFSTASAEFIVVLPPSLMEIAPRRLQVELVKGRLAFTLAQSDRWGGQDCWGNAPVDSAGHFATFDLRCSGNDGRGQMTYTRITGRLVDAGGSLRLEFAWQDGFGKSGEAKASQR